MNENALEPQVCYAFFHIASTSAHLMVTFSEVAVPVISALDRIVQFDDP